MSASASARRADSPRPREMGPSRHRTRPTRRRRDRRGCGRDPVMEYAATQATVRRISSVFLTSMCVVRGGAQCPFRFEANTPVVLGPAWPGCWRRGSPPSTTASSRSWTGMGVAGAAGAQARCAAVGARATCCRPPVPRCSRSCCPVSAMDRRRRRAGVERRRPVEDDRRVRWSPTGRLGPAPQPGDQLLTEPAVAGLSCTATGFGTAECHRARRPRDVVGLTSTADRSRVTGVVVYRRAPPTPPCWLPIWSSTPPDGARARRSSWLTSA